MQIDEKQANSENILITCAREQLKHNQIEQKTLQIQHNQIQHNSNTWQADESGVICNTCSALLCLVALCVCNACVVKLMKIFSFANLI